MPEFTIHPHNPFMIWKTESDGIERPFSLHLDDLMTKRYLVFLRSLDGLDLPTVQSLISLLQ